MRNRNAWVDHATRSRLAGTRIGGIAYATFLAPLAVAISVGAAPLSWTAFLALALAAALATLAFHAAIRSGWTRRFRDPGLTAVQILTSAGLTLLMAKYAGDARSVLLMLAFCGLMFGMYTLSLRVMLALVTAILAGYAGLVLGPEWSAGSTRQNVIELLRFATLGCVLVATAVFAHYAGRLRRRLRRMAMHDELTGACNRRFLMEQLRRELERCHRHGGSFAVAILDLDRFKQVNDQLGHERGDQVLQAFTRVLAGALRGHDSLARAAGSDDSVVGRLGGEEFMLILPHCDQAGARACLERLRASVAGSPLDTAAGPVQVTFSAGFAVHHGGHGNGDTLLRRADQALYRAKSAGRNRVEAEAAPLGVPAVQQCA